MKIRLTREQKYLTSEIPELDSLVRMYLLLDRLITRYKNRAGTLIEIEKVDSFMLEVDHLRKDLLTILNELGIDRQSCTEVITGLNNPEIDRISLSALVTGYRDVKRTIHGDNLMYALEKIAGHIEKINDIMKRYSTFNYIPPSRVLELVNLVTKQD